MAYWGQIANNTKGSDWLLFLIRRRTVHVAKLPRRLAADIKRWFVSSSQGSVLSFSLRKVRYSFVARKPLQASPSTPEYPSGSKIMVSFYYSGGKCLCFISHFHSNIHTTRPTVSYHILTLSRNLFFPVKTTMQFNKSFRILKSKTNFKTISLFGVGSVFQLMSSVYFCFISALFYWWCG